MFTSDFISALQECVNNNNPQAFGLIVRRKFVFSRLYEEGKEPELDNLLGYIENQFSEKYFTASMQALGEFLLQQQFMEKATHGGLQVPLNSICRSLMVAEGIENQSQLLVELSSQSPSKEDSQFEEIPSQKKIIERRNFFGQLKVFTTWFFIWNTIHQLVWDLILAFGICGIVSTCTSENLPLLRGLRILIGVFTSIAQMNIRMNHKASRRWKQKYG